MKQSKYAYAKRAAVPDRTGPDGFVYDSATEMRRGIELQMLERGKVISDLKRQEKFPLEFKCSCGGIQIMAGKKVAVYTADFVYMENGVRVVEDVKGYDTESSKLRIRVFESLYRQKVTILKREKGRGWVSA